MYSEQVYGLLENLVFKVPVMYVKVFCLMYTVPLKYNVALARNFSSSKMTTR